MQLFAILRINPVFHFGIFQASEEQILGAGSGPSESEGVKTNSKEVGKSKLKQTSKWWENKISKSKKVKTNNKEVPAKRK